MFKGVELYLWHLDGKPVWTILPGTNRLKFDNEIRNATDAIKSKEELEKLLAKLAPGEYVFFKNTLKSEDAKSESARGLTKELCTKFKLNFVSDESPPPTTRPEN